MYIKFLSMNLLPAVFCFLHVGCIVPRDGYEPLTHVASLENIGKQEVFDAVLFFGSGGFKMGIVPPGAAKNISRTGDDIPEYARAEWRRADGSVYMGTVRIEMPKETETRERYIIQINDDNLLSINVEIPKPLPKKKL